MNEKYDILSFLLAGRFPPAKSKLTDTEVIVGNSKQFLALLYLYDNYIAEEWYETWPQFSWLADEL